MGLMETRLGIVIEIEINKIRNGMVEIGIDEINFGEIRVGNLHGQDLCLY